MVSHGLYNYLSCVLGMLGQNMPLPDMNAITCLVLEFFAQNITHCSARIRGVYGRYMHEYVTDYVQN